VRSSNSNSSFSFFWCVINICKVNSAPELAAINFDSPKNAKLFAILLPRGDQEWINFINHWIKDKKNKGFFSITAIKFGL
jgi:cyclohexadienyl dehydratase